MKSKIEEALRRAQRARHGAVVRVDPSRESNSPDHGQDGLPTVVTGRGELSERTGGDDIARMREIEPPSTQGLASLGIIHSEAAENGVVKAFRELRTKILQRVNGRNCCIMVSGVSRASGSSFVAANLAAAFVRDTSKTALLVDCSLHHPWVHRLVQAPNALGLVDYLENPELDVSQIIHPVGIPRLRVVPLGRNRGGSAEYFSSAGMKTLLQGMVERYPDRYIIVDAPPFTESADMQILAELCDFALVVLAYGNTTESEAINAVKAIGREKFLGFVFNDTPDLPPLNWRQILRGALGLRTETPDAAAQTPGENP